MDIFTFRETPSYYSTPCKKKRASCLMRDEIALSSSAYNEFKREMSSMKVRYPFLTESQIKGRTMDKFGIPNIMGKPYKFKSGCVTYSTVNHVLYLIKKSFTENKCHKKNRYVKRRQTVSGAYVPIDVITTKCHRKKNLKSRQNLEKRFSLYFEENEMLDEDYSIETTSEYSQGRHSDKLSISEFGCSYHSDEDEALRPHQIRNSYERKSKNMFPTLISFKERKKASLENSHSNKLALNQNIKSPNKIVSEINLVDKEENYERMYKQTGNDFKGSEQRNEELSYVPNTNSFDLSNSSKNKVEESSISTQNTNESKSYHDNLADVSKKPTKSSRITQKNSMARSRAKSEAGDCHFKETFQESEIKLDEETDELEIIYEKVVYKGTLKLREGEKRNNIKCTQEKKSVSDASSVIENSQEMNNMIGIKPKYIKQSISVCSSEFLLQDNSQSSTASSSVKEESQTLQKYFQRSRPQKISVPFINRESTLEDYKRRRGYWRKTSECIIVVDLEGQTDSEHNVSMDECSSTLGENLKADEILTNSLPDPASEDSNDSVSDTDDSLADSVKQNGKLDLNVAFSPHFATQNVLDDSSDGDLSSQETNMAELNSRSSERSTTNEGYYLANLFDDDDDPSTRQRTLRSTSMREINSHDDEPTFVD